MRNGIYTFLSIVSLTAAPLAWADAGGEPGRESNGPNPLNNVYFGEQHLHTSTSVDAYMQGNHKNTIEDAFNYNKGKPVKKWITGETLQRRTPYDWTAVTDHAEYMGVFEQLSDPKNPIAGDTYVKAINSGDEKKEDAAFVRLADTLTSGQPYEPFDNKPMIRTSWEGTVTLTPSVCSSAVIVWTRS